MKAKRGLAALGLESSHNMASWLAAVGFKTTTLAAGVRRDDSKICNPRAALAWLRRRDSCGTALGIHSVDPALVYFRVCGAPDPKLMLLRLSLNSKPFVAFSSLNCLYSLSSKRCQSRQDVFLSNVYIKSHPNISLVSAFYLPEKSYLCHKNVHLGCY